MSNIPFTFTNIVFPTTLLPPEYCILNCLFWSISTSLCVVSSVKICKYCDDECMIYDQYTKNDIKGENDDDDEDENEDEDESELSKNIKKEDNSIERI